MADEQNPSTGRHFKAPEAASQPGAGQPAPKAPASDNPYIRAMERSQTKRTSTPRMGKVGASVDPDELQEAHERHAKQSRRARYAVVGGLLAAVTVVALIVTIAMGGVPGADEAAAAEPDESSEVATGPTTVSLSAVGDNLMHTPVIDTADAAEGELGDGLYDFKVVYEGIRDVIETHDINFIDIETPMGGDERGISGGEQTSASGAPVFNTPSDNAADIADFGFNLATTASNHANDQGYEGIVSMMDTWAQHPEVVVAGTYTSEEDRGTIRTFEKNGITFAFLAYTMAVNDALPADYPDYAIAFADDDRIESDVAKAHELADAVIVSMSWGDEYYMSVARDQRKYAQFLANLDVDLVIGFHPHVIGPVEWVEGKDAQLQPTGHRTLVAYSVGNLVSGPMQALSNVSGIFTCDFVRDDAGAITVGNPGWIPTVIHYSGNSGHRVYQLKDYTSELGYSHDVLSGVGDAVEYAKNVTLQAIDPEVVAIDWGDGGSEGQTVS